MTLDMAIAAAERTEAVRHARFADLVPRFRLTVNELFIIPKRDDERPELGC